MANKQKEITLEDVKKMTLEEFRALPPEQKATFTQEQKDEIRAKVERREVVKRGAFIETKDYFEFFAQNGYKLEGYDTSNRNWDRADARFSKFGDYRPWLDEALVLLGDEEERGDRFEGFYCRNIVNNPFVRYIRLGPTEFNIYTVVLNSDAGGWGNDEPFYAYKLEKNLSKEWVKFLALKNEEYRQYILSECKRVQREIPENIERRNNMLAKHIAELEKQTAEHIAADNKELERYNQIEQVVKSVKSDLQV